MTKKEIIKQVYLNRGYNELFFEYSQVLKSYGGFISDVIDLALKERDKHLLKALNCAYANCNKKKMTPEAIELIESAIDKAEKQ